MPIVVAPYTYSIQVIKVNVLCPFYDYRYGCATGKGTAIVGRTVILFQPEVVPEMAVLHR